MLRITFKNELGELEFSTYQGQNRIDEMTGFEMLPPSYHTVSGNYGVKTVDTTPAPRTMTLKFELTYNGDMFLLHRKRAKLSQILSKPGVLTVQRYHTKRKIDVQQITLEPGERCEIWQDYIVQFTADDPYFHDIHNIELPIFQRVDHITNTFTLPMVFTTKLSKTNIVMEGHEKVRPTIRIYNKSTSGTATGSDEIGFRIENHTTGQKLKINHTTVNGEVITINTQSGDITSSVKGDIIESLDLESFLSNFWLTPGINEVSVTNFNLTEEITTICEYSNNYVEACV